MSKVFIEESTLTAIGDAIRAKDGSTELIAPLNMATAIINLPSGGGGDIEIPEVIEISNISTLNRYGAWDWVLGQGKPLTIKAAVSTNRTPEYVMSGSQLEDLSQVILIVPSGLGTDCFNGCRNLKKLPKLYVGHNGSGNATYGTFQDCYNLREIPDDFFVMKDENGNATTEPKTYFPKLSNNNNFTNYTFSNCRSLRKLPDLGCWEWPTTLMGKYSNTFQYCCALDEIRDLEPPFKANSSSFTSSTFNYTNRLKSFTFALDNGVPKVVGDWSSVSINLGNATYYIGYGNSKNTSLITGYNSGITEDTRIIDDATYQVLKDHPDAWTTDVNYSRYNRISAVETINSLPDTSVASTSGGNIIKFLGVSGALTDGGAINTLTEEEIAVATAKGWTVSLV